MEIILSIIGIVLIVFVLFIITGLLGWGIHYLGAIVGLFGTRFMGLHWVSPKNLSSYIYISRPNYIFLLNFFEIFPSYYYIIKVYQKERIKWQIKCLYVSSNTPILDM